MHFSYTLLAASAAAIVLAAPATPNDTSLEPRGARKDTKVPPHIQACLNASNCETWTDDKGRTRIRFKPGQGPSDEAYNKRIGKRALGELRTQVTMSDSKVAWGCGKDPYLVLGNIEKICADSGACISNTPYETDIKYVEPCDGCTAGHAHDETLSITATGTYSRELKNAFIEAIRQLGAHKVKWNRDQHYAGFLRKRDNGAIDNPNADHGGICDVASQSAFLHVGRFRVTNKGKPNEDEELEGFMDVDISLPDMSAGACDVIGPAADIGAAISAPIANGGLAPIFGVIHGVCSVFG
jgi:hypothetical protein